MDAVADPVVTKCCNCMAILVDWADECPSCETDEYIMDTLVKE